MDAFGAGILIFAAGAIAGLLGYELGVLVSFAGYLITGASMASNTSIRFHFEHHVRFQPVREALMHVGVTIAIVVGWPVFLIIGRPERD